MHSGKKYKWNNKTQTPLKINVWKYFLSIKAIRGARKGKIFKTTDPK